MQTTRKQRRRPVRVDQFADGRTRWIDCRAQVLVAIRKMHPVDAKAKAEAEFEEFQRLDNSPNVGE